MNQEVLDSVWSWIFDDLYVKPEGRDMVSLTGYIKRLMRLLQIRVGLLCAGLLPIIIIEDEQFTISYQIKLSG